MTAQTQNRPGSVKTVKRERRPLAANAKVWVNALAVCIVAAGATGRGFYKEGAASPTTVVVGRFTEAVDNTGGAAGAKFAEIEFFEERELFLLANDAGTAVVAADRESPCYVLDDQTVTGAVTSSTPAGLVYDVTSEGVWVEVARQPKIPIQFGTNTLVAGTKTITGVRLTANSAIVITMRDPGAGAITGMAGFDAPVGSRNATTGQFVVNAIDDAKATIATAVCTFDYVIVG